jgi:hypothetical protein
MAPFFFHHLALGSGFGQSMWWLNPPLGSTVVANHPIATQLYYYLILIFLFFIFIFFLKVN